MIRIGGDTWISARDVVRVRIIAKDTVMITALHGDTIQNYEVSVYGDETAEHLGGEAGGGDRERDSGGPVKLMRITFPMCWRGPDDRRFTLIRIQTRSYVLGSGWKFSMSFAPYLFPRVRRGYRQLRVTVLGINWHWRGGWRK